MTGWGIFLGLYIDEKRARRSLDKTLRTLREAARTDPVLRFSRKSRAAILPRGTPDRRSFKVVLGGLTVEQAGSACKALTARGTLCLAQSPNLMALDGYAER